MLKACTGIYKPVRETDGKHTAINVFWTMAHVKAKERL